MTKAKCRELYDQMKVAIEQFEDALFALRKCTRMGPDEEGKVKIECHARITGNFDHFEHLNCDLFLLDAGEALEQTVED